MTWWVGRGADTGVSRSDDPGGPGAAGAWGAGRSACAARARPRQCVSVLAPLRPRPSPSAPVRSPVDVPIPCPRSRRTGRIGRAARGLRAGRRGHRAGRRELRARPFRERPFGEPPGDGSRPRPGRHHARGHPSRVRLRGGHGDLRRPGARPVRLRAGRHRSVRARRRRRRPGLGRRGRGRGRRGHQDPHAPRARAVPHRDGSGDHRRVPGRRHGHRALPRRPPGLRRRQRPRRQRRT